MDQPDDLDDYLSGGSALSRQYRRETAPTPPHALDRRVLRAAHAETRGRTPCLAPLAFAASALLSVALVLAIVFGPQRVKRADDPPRIVRAAVRMDGASAPLRHELRLYSSDPLRVREPAAWLADIAALRRAGRAREAEMEFRRFRSVYPHYAVDEAPIRP